MICIRLLTGIPGSGKTRLLVNELASAPKKYLLVNSRVDLIHERMREIRHAAAQHGTAPDVIPIYEGTGGGLPVASQIRSLARHATNQHTIALCTHSGAMSADLSGYVGWDVVFDEIPAAIASGAMRVPATALYLADAYRLEQYDAEWYRVLPTQDAPKPSSLMNDDGLDLASFDKMARSAYGLFVDVQDFASLKDSSTPLQWWSAWTPLELRSFDRITIAAAGFEHSIPFKVYEKFLAGEIIYEFQKVPSPPRARQQIEIAYFTDSHTSSTAFWAKPHGKAALQSVAAYLATVPNLGYMSSNNPTAGFFTGVQTEFLSPCQEGSNLLIDRESVAFIYSAKFLPQDIPLRRVFDIDKATIERSRQQEHCIQFCCRGSIRDPQWSGTYRIFLYDRTQAEALRGYFVANGIGDTVDLIPIDEAGIMDVPGSKSGPKSTMTPEQKKARQREHEANHRAKKKANLVAAGITPRERGRPKREAA